MKRFFCGLLVFLFLAASVPSTVFADDTAPVKKLSWPEAPEITAAGAIVMEASTGTILYEKNAYEAYYPASTTKLMTSLLAIEQCPLSDVVTCSYNSIHSIDKDSSRIGLTVGEQVTMEEALYAILLASANEVSYAVAEHIGGTIDNFVAMMNKRAAELGCVNTNFKNPHGLDNEEHVTCAYDLALITKQAISYTTFRRISGSYYYEIPETNLNVARPIGNTHQIIRKIIKYDGVFAGKTGHTSIAKNSLVTCAERDGLTLICVVMREDTSEQAYTDTIALLDYSFKNFHLYELSTSDMASKNAFPALFEDKDALVFDVQSPLSISSTSLVLPLEADLSDLTKQVELVPSTSFAEGNNIIGKVSYYYADNYAGSAEIMYYSSRPVTLVADSSSDEEVTATLSGNTNSYGGKIEDSGKDLRPLIIGAIVFLLTLVLGGYVVLIELPYRKRKKEYLKRKRSEY